MSWKPARALYRIDLRSRPLQNILDLPDLLGRARSLRRVNRATHVLHPPVHFHHRLAEDALRELRDLREDVVDQRLVLGEMLSPFFCDLVDLLAAFLWQCPRVAEILEHCQSRIDGTGTRRVHPAKPFLDLLDDLVAVARLLVEQPQNHELEMPLVEHPP